MTKNIMNTGDAPSDPKAASTLSRRRALQAVGTMAALPFCPVVLAYAEPAHAAQFVANRLWQPTAHPISSRRGPLEAL
ncbi:MULTISPECIES: hypothetical protein [unclassified Variovorax]|uniref:hypothetical protein n=1 Tax=unclassified Variovorax TaxID=663243 RepID=UPI00089A639C|nr:hypothetical protein [Variovorax sp. YR266]SDY29725.1 hypothetical protein SAMN05518854_101723 [Variovorax sp. YR266]